MKDDIVKNPNRQNRKVPEVTKYIPQHIALGVKPIEPPNTMGNALPINIKKEEKTEYWSFNNSTAFTENGDEVQLPSGEVIDNNEFMDLGPYNSIPDDNNSPLPPLPQQPQPEPQVGEYILMVFGKMIISGNFSAIEKKVKDIIYGEDKEFANTEVSIDDIIVLKRLNVKIGIFIEE